MKFLSNLHYGKRPVVLRTIIIFMISKSKKGESVETKFDNDRSSPSEDPSELENFNSLTEKDRIPTAKLEIPEKAFLKSESRTSVTFKL